MKSNFFSFGDINRQLVLSWPRADIVVFLLSTFFLRLGSKAQQTAQLTPESTVGTAKDQIATPLWDDGKHPANHDSNSQDGSKIAIFFFDGNKVMYDKLQLTTTEYHRHPCLQDAINIHDSASRTIDCRFTVTLLLMWSAAPVLHSAARYCTLLHICVYRSSAGGNRPLRLIISFASHRCDDWRHLTQVVLLSVRRELWSEYAELFFDIFRVLPHSIRVKVGSRSTLGGKTAGQQ